MRTRNCANCLFKIADPGFCVNGCPKRGSRVSIDATDNPTPEVESAARRQAEWRERRWQTDAEALKAEQRVRVMHVLGDAVRGYKHAAEMFRDAAEVMQSLSDLTEPEVRLIFWMMEVRSVRAAAKRLGIRHQRAYEIKRSVLRKHPEFGGVFKT